MKIHEQKPTVAERLLALRERAGGDETRHNRYHLLVLRYQKLILRDYRLKQRLRHQATLAVSGC